MHYQTLRKEIKQVELYSISYFILKSTDINSLILRTEKLVYFV